ncbi:MAG: hypothetical protein WBC04_12375 [Candidatus Acidiferrales bacterium]
MRIDPLALLRFIPAGKEGQPRGACESCDLLLWSDGGYRVPGLKGLCCSLVCIECAIATKTGQRKKIAEASIGSGARLMVYLRSEAPELYAKLADQSHRTCKTCGTTLEELRVDAAFCSDTCRKRFGKSKTGEKPGIIAETPIGKQGLTDARFPRSTDTLIRQGEAL